MVGPISNDKLMNTDKNGGVSSNQQARILLMDGVSVRGLPISQQEGLVYATSVRIASGMMRFAALTTKKGDNRQIFFTGKICSYKAVPCFILN
jgi:hypothetical protein